MTYNEQKTEEQEKTFKDKIVDVAIKIVDKLPARNTILFESHPDMTDNTYWFFKYLSENDRVCNKYKLVWVVKKRESVRDELCGREIKCIINPPESFSEKVSYYYNLHSAKFIFDCNNYIMKHNPHQIRIFMGHGMPLKIIRDYDLNKGEVDMNMITSYIFNRYYFTVGNTNENTRNYGYCRTDILASNAGKRQKRDTTNIIWMPTYRQHSKGVRAIKNNFPLGLPVIKNHEQMTEINETLKENNTILYIRPHPVQDMSVLHLEEMSNITIANDEFLHKKGLQLYEFLTQTDALITDYSSVYYDYLMLERPIGLAIEDLDDFSAKWPMFFDDFKANYKCPYIYTVDDMKEFIKNVADDKDEYEEERLKAKNRFYDYTDNKVCERIYNFAVEEYGL